MQYSWWNLVLNIRSFPVFKIEHPLVSIISTSKTDSLCILTPFQFLPFTTLSLFLFYIPLFSHVPSVSFKFSQCFYYAVCYFISPKIVCYICDDTTSFHEKNIYVKRNCFFLTFGQLKNKNFKSNYYTYSCEE